VRVRSQASPEKAAGNALRQQADQDDRGASSATSPNTGVVTKVRDLIDGADSADAEIVPLRMAAPPDHGDEGFSDMATPMVGNTPDTGASTAPARPDRAAPMPKVTA